MTMGRRKLFTLIMGLVISLTVPVTLSGCGTVRSHWGVEGEYSMPAGQNPRDKKPKKKKNKKKKKSNRKSKKYTLHIPAQPHVIIDLFESEIPA